jgi:dTDP-4-amino-4,6-dideoxygalactose transaminase
MNRTVPFLDLRVTDPDARRELLDAVDAVLAHGRLVMGPEVDEFERRMASRCGRRFAVGVSSGSDALFLALRVAGIGSGDEVVTTSLSWVATANAIAMAGATPVFADIADDLNIDPASVERVITPRTRAIVPVHFTGRICRMAALLDIARARGLVVVEDAAQAFGAVLNGRPAGSFGDLACFSMNAMKVLAACGDAGIIVTDREDWRDRLVALRYNGTINRETCVEPGLNGRLDTLQAAMLLKRLDRVDAILARRREIAAWYAARLARLVTTPTEIGGERHGWYTYQIRTPWRDELMEFLHEHGIECKIQHGVPIPCQPAYRLDARGEWMRASELVSQILCIPANEKLEPDALEYVASRVEHFVRQKMAMESVEV